MASRVSARGSGVGKGGLSCRGGASRSASWSSMRSVNSVPTPPTCCRSPCSSGTPRIREPIPPARRPFPRAPSGDDDLLHPLVFDLAPVWGPLPRAVGGGSALGHDALQAVLGAGGHHVLGGAGGAGRPPPRRRVKLEVVKQGAALAVRQLQQWAVVQA